HPDVVSAVTVSVQHGQNFVRPHQYEAVAAERMIELIDSADMVKFGLNGSDATTAAIRLARAATGRDLVARCADHPFFSVDDWFIGTTEMDAGIPRPARESTLSFRYNDAASLAELFESRPGQFAAVILEAQNTTPPAPGFLQEVRELCDRHGVVMVLDEIITGFRWDLKGAQHRFGIRPDLSTFAKAMANGFPCSALAGRRDLMQLG